MTSKENGSRKGEVLQRISNKLPNGRANKVAASVGAVVCASGLLGLAFGATAMDGYKEVTSYVGLDNSCTFSSAAGNCRSDYEQNSQDEPGRAMMLGSALIAAEGGLITFIAYRRAKYIDEAHKAMIEHMVTEITEMDRDELGLHALQLKIEADKGIPLPRTVPRE